MSSDELKCAWVSRGWTKKEKPWGHEMSWSAFQAGHGKLLFLKKGHRTSLKYNPQKCETLVVISGSVEVTYGDEKTILKPTTHPFQNDILNPGDCLHVYSNCPYRIKAMEDSHVVEIGNFITDQPVRIEDDYGRG
jgi:mannose-6-phosphate isomerase-like protein (cupin superfamily)|tara:strand:+ start:3586 stop:3990 length:405 start_codon:yes stop_codon:yes gene_type:complete